jgi:hypothetical protein
MWRRKLRLDGPTDRALGPLFSFSEKRCSLFSFFAFWSVLLLAAEDDDDNDGIVTDLEIPPRLRPKR